MSSILKALKKLEKDTLDQQNEPKPSMGFNIRSEKSRRQENSRNRKKTSVPWAWIVPSLLVFLGAGALTVEFFHDRQGQTEVASNNAPTDIEGSSTVRPQVAVADSPQPIDYSPPVRPQQAVEKLHGEPPPPKMPSTLAKKPQAKVLKTPALAGTQESNISMGHSAPTEPPGSTPHAMAEDSPPVVDEKKSEPTIISATHGDRVNGIPSPNEIPIFSDNSLTINAIAWSNDPAKRLAVINSQIVRQGQNVGEFLIVKIEEQQVIVQQADKKWRVRFRMR